MKKSYINVRDYQGGSWSMGHISTIKEWKEYALQWCDSDENWELYREIKKHKLDTDLLDIISEIWDIKIIEFNKQNLEEIKENYSVHDYEWLIYDILDKMESGEFK